LALTAAGCSTPTTLFGGGDTAATTTATAPAATASTQPSKAKLAFAPIVGAPAAVADMLSASIVSAVERQSVPVARTPTDQPDYTVRGYVVAAPDKAGTKLSYIWDVTDKTGQRAHRITGEEILKGKKTKDPWAQVDQSVVDRIAQSTSSQLVGWVPMKNGTAAQPPGAPQQTSTLSSFGKLFGFGNSDQTAAAAPASPAQPDSQPAPLPASTSSAPKPGSLVTGTVTPSDTTASLGPANGQRLTAVAPVIGAPGDGATSLAQALQHSLGNAGIQLASAPGAGSYTVQGKVAMGQPSGGKQTIKIEWIVLDPAGKKVGTVSQNNVVPQGSLDGPWGKTAELAATAAAQGIIKLLPKQSG
jgi:hypothetical protein